MAAYEVLLLNTAIPQIQAAQSGDTYVVPRDIAFSTVASFAAGAEATPSIVATGDTNTGIWFPAADTVAISTGGTSRLRLDSSGNLGLGVTPSAWSGVRAIQLTNVSGSMGIYGAGQNEFGAVANCYYNGTNWIYAGNFTAARYAISGGQHQWFNAASGTAGNAISFTQAMTLDASGNLLVGLTSGAYKFMVGDGTRDMCINPNSTLDAIFLGTTTNKPLILGANSAERARITSGGNLDLQKNIGLGGTSATTSGTGITFPATQSASSDANTLDDYEEGVHTAVVTCSTSGTVTLNSSIDVLSYTKIGRQVTVTGLLSVSSVSSPVGYFSVSLPFAIGDFSESSEHTSGSVAVLGTNAANVSNFVVLGTTGESAFRVYLGDGTTVQSDSAEELKSSTEIWVSFTYFV